MTSEPMYPGDVVISAEYGSNGRVVMVTEIDNNFYATVRYDAQTVLTDPVDRFSLASSPHVSGICAWKRR